ncbi:MAG: hypothetical protein JWM68_2115 [Verrucomicrobiales bacterium]|nr:hypothetical protein [Verrucomicrobiales bacterium]
MSKPPDDELLNDVFTGEARPEFRAASLECALGAVRQRRRGRRAMNITAALAFVAGLGILLKSLTLPDAPMQPILAVNPQSFAKENIKMVPGTHIRVLSDEELVAMFPDRPIALIGPPEHRQLIFLDEQQKPGLRDAVN